MSVVYRKEICYDTSEVFIEIVIDLIFVFYACLFVLSHVFGKEYFFR